MAAWMMWTLTVLVFALPFLLAVAFNGGDRADSRGRPISRSWHT